MATPNSPMAKHVESPFTLLKHYCSVLGFALPICKTKEIQKSTVIRITQWMLVGPHFAGPSRTVSPVGHYNLPSQNQQAAGWWHAWWKGLSCPKGKEAKTESWKSEAQFTDVCHGFQRAMTGAKESGMDRKDGNELWVYMEMIKGEIEKKKCKHKICLMDEWFVVTFLPLLSSRLLQRSGAGQKAGTKWCPLSEPSLPQILLGKKSSERRGRQELFFTVLEMNTASHLHASFFSSPCSPYLPSQCPDAQLMAIPPPKPPLQTDPVPILHEGCLGFHVWGSGAKATLLSASYVSVASKAKMVHPAWITASGHWATLCLLCWKRDRFTGYLSPTAANNLFGCLLSQKYAFQFLAFSISVWEPTRMLKHRHHSETKQCTRWQHLLVHVRNASSWSRSATGLVAQ